MTARSRFLLVACIMLAVAGFAAAQGYTVVAVLPDGSVILRGPEGVRQYAVPAGTQFNADGKAGTAIKDLKPGMKVTGFESGIASWKGTNVMVHEELNAEAVNKAGNTMLLRGANGLTNKYEWVDAGDITLIKDGKVVDIGSINVGDRITGMVVQKAAPGKADTSAADAAARAAAAKAAADKAAADKAAADRAAAAKAAADKSAADRAAAKAAADKAAADAAAQAAADKAAADAAAAKTLPKTASEVPLAGLAGVLFLAAGVGLTAIRKSRSAK